MSQRIVNAIVVTVLVVSVVGCGTGARPADVAGDADDASGPPASSTEAMSPAVDDDAQDEMAMGSEPEEMDPAEDEHDEAFGFGEPADPADADRTVEVQTLEEGGFHYEPTAIEVSAGETVTFRVHNVGEATHEFVLGDDRTQADHEAEMRAMASDDGMMMHDEPNAVSVAPGATKRLTWTFTEPGELIYGCHEPGHYAAGMRGDLTVTP